MLRIFLPLWVIVITLIVTALTVDIYNPIIELQKSVASNYMQQTYKGTFHLINRELSSYPESQWDQYIDDLNQEFGYRLRLDTPEELAADIGDLPPLTTDSITLIISDSDGETDYLCQKVGTRDRILTLYLGETEEDDSIRMAQGTIHLINAELMPHPFEEWSQIIERLKPQFGFDLHFKPLSEFNFDDKLKKKLIARSIAWHMNEDGSEYIYVHYPEHDYALAAGPVNYPQEAALLTGIFTILATIVGMGVFVGLWPVWRDLSRIDKAATAFGRGELDKRVKIPRLSGLRRLGNSFNSMAGSIEKLITSHRDLTNAVSHDLRTPLARLKFAVEMLEEENNADERRRYQNTIKNSVDSLEHLINQSLVHSRFMRTPNMANFKQENLHQLLTEEIELSNDMAEHLNIRLEASQTLQQQTVRIDKNAVIRAVNNLLSNAIRYANHDILVQARVIKKHIEISVSDDGCGIPESEHEKIFQPFTQLDNAAREGDKRHGLGLAIVQQIAQWHKGEVHLRKSTLGGAEFIIRWPQ